jgi:tRNA-2-methylthio-N6-dimethylallyladenosine synthase
MKKYFIRAFGCQMNTADAERISGGYEENGWQLADKIEEADEIVIVSCSVRQSAENRVCGLVNNLNKLKAQGSKFKVILTGCMLRLPKEVLEKKLPGVEFKRIEELIHGSSFIVRGSSVHAWIPISNGCNNFCTYCVVPYSRGREISRLLEEIVCEVEELARRGYKEITLLGQNVNSYGKDLKNFKLPLPDKQISNYKTKFTTPFAILLERLHGIEGISKISFITSNPWDLNDEIIEAMSLPKIDRNLHLPVQSGDDEILRRMNRKYTSQEYLALVDKIKKKIPEIIIGTDIIVGFPGETEEQFEHTVDLAKKVGFEKAYIAMYSPREQTAAYKMKDNVPYKEKKKRWKILDDLINKKDE